MSGVTSAAQKPQILIAKDIKAAGVSGQTLTAGVDNIRELSSPLSYNSIAGASIAGNRITLPKGTYEVDGLVPCAYTNLHAARLYNVTTASTEIMGAIKNSHQSGYADTLSIIEGVIVLSVETEFEIRHRVQTTKATGGGDGRAITGHSEDNVFTIIKFRKIG